MDLKPLFEPRSMAVFGVSLSNDRHPANEIFNKNLLRYPVRVFGVNPGRDDQRRGDPSEHRGGARTGRSCGDCGQGRSRPGGALRVYRGEGPLRCGHLGRLREVGRQDLQARIADIAKEASFPFIGPTVWASTPLSRGYLLSPGERMVTPAVGNVSFVSQSGGILVDQMINFTNEGVGLAKAISIGNKALLGELEILDYLAADPVTKVIAFYNRRLRRERGPEFVLRAERCGKPVVVLKSGKSPGGSAPSRAIRRPSQETMPAFLQSFPSTGSWRRQTSWSLSPSANR